MSENQGYSSVAVALPIADRRRSYDFYTDALGLEPVGPVASEGIPEPLMLRVNDGLRLVLVPTGGFGSVIGEHEVAGESVAECLLRIEQESQTAVGALVDRARAAGARVVAEPGQRPWGFEGIFADPDGHLWVVAEAGN
jgi:predicted lactoylglutathione lyase